MVSLETPVCDFDQDIFDFSLPGVGGKVWTPELCRGENGLLVMFICNHCPYVKSIRERIVRDTRELMVLGVNSVAIMSNDSSEYEEDSFENGHTFQKVHRTERLLPHRALRQPENVVVMTRHPRR